MSAEHSIYLDNKYLNKAEYHLGRLSLYSMPRYLTLVLGNGCNIDCRHCYQLKNGDNLLRDTKISLDLRQELSVFYPYLSTLRLQGGEVFALRGFEALLEDVGTFVKRPLISISTNGTLINERWAERLVDLPLQSLTISLDAGTATTFERLRRGANFATVIANIRRIQRLKHAKGSSYPVIDAFFVIMRSNFREIPLFLELLMELGIRQVSFQIILVDPRNLEREPDLGTEEIIKNPDEIRELHTILKKVTLLQSPWFHRIAWSGLNSLFLEHGLDADFLHEQSSTLTPDQDNAGSADPDAVNSHAHLIPPEVHDKLGAFPSVTCADEHLSPTCPNPWSTMFITENGDVSLCFLSDPVGNLYQTPLVQLWNGPAAIAKRSDMLHGRYLESGCSGLWCNWRQGSKGPVPTPESWRQLLKLSGIISKQMKSPQLQDADATLIMGDKKRGLQAVRRLLQERDTRIKELEAVIVDLWDKNSVLHEAGQKHINHLENRVKELENIINHGNPQQSVKDVCSALIKELEELICL